MNPVDAILLDLDDTLIPSSQAYKLALLKVGIPGPTGSRESYLRARTRVKERLADDNPSSHNRLLYFLEMMRENGDYNPTRTLELMMAYETALAEYLSEQWRQLSRDRLLRRIGEGRRLVVVTNETARTQLAKLSAVDPEGRHFNDIVTSEEVGAEKPSPRILEEAIQRLSTTADRCLVVGDSTEDDILPARGLGCSCVLTREFVQDPGIVPDDVVEVTSLDALIEVLGP